MRRRLFKTSKINEFRLWGLIFTLAGMVVMIGGTAGILLWGAQGRLFAAISIVIGMLLLLASMVIYFCAGLLSTRTVIVTCPACARETKIIGKMDRCMFCRTILTFDPSQATKN